jgi:ATP adenylyltransferase
VPRWAGDVNFMNVVAEVKIIPQATEELYKELVALLAKA